MSRKVQRVLAVILACMHLLLASCGSLGQGHRARKPPQPPAEVKAEMVDKGIQVSWKAPPGATRYTVFWGFSAGQYRGILNTDDRAVILAGLTKGELLYFAVTAWNDSGESKYSEEQVVINDDDVRRVRLYISKGQAALQNREFPEADAYLTAAARLDPQNAEAYRYLGKLYESLSKSELAKEFYMKAEKVFKKSLLSEHRLAG